MPSTLMQGSRGADVTTLQTLLNYGHSGYPPLKVDGIFGPKTLARVQEFQRQNGLTVDGIVGPKTWAALEKIPVPEHTAGRRCGTGDPGNAQKAAQIQQLVAKALSQESARPAFALTSFSAAPVSFISSPLSIPNLTPFTGSTHDKPAIHTVYGTSIDFSRVYFSNQAGLQNRPFTIAVKLPFMPASAALQVMNLGPAPTDDDVKHEMAHVWQSQHHTDPFQFMRGCVACQAFALALNGQAAQMDPTLVTKTKQGFPEAYPFDAYAYKPG